MTVHDILSALPVKCVAGKEASGAIVLGGYASDLLSNVMGQAKAGSVWVTMQGHKNIVAVASLAGLSAIVIAGGSKPDADTLAKAESENIALLITDLPVFEFVGQLYALGVKGR
ncbi:serine kinase [Anaerosporomusa subterranea]|uniref:Serine kinase n=1 Tax=Anaerosporomusa subterranea TaxID=1794912 RepID=A0A154BSF8_ANASB|nr:serine kinase [Anaerosporomusa subterranea]KYZ76805.1 serine kinase [Anaerosporomusa subterranea]